MAWMAEHARFLLHFIKNPTSIGAVAPSSPWLASMIVQDMGLERARTVVEVGPGTGAFTAATLRRIPADAFFMAVELNREFAEAIRRRYPRVRVVNDSAENLEHHLEDSGRVGQVDAVISSLPWAGFPPELQERLLGPILRSLRPGGKFATFAYVHARGLPAGKRFRALLDRSFRFVDVTRVEWRNLPPAVVYRGERA